VPFVQRLTFSADPSGTAPEVNLTQWNWNRQVAVDDAGTVHVVWARLGTADINLPADQPDPVNGAALPAGQIFYKRSTDRGVTWSTDLPLTGRENGVDSASVATSGADVYVTWRALDGGRLRVFCSSSGDGGSTWDAPVAVSDNPPGISVSPPAVAASVLRAGSAPEIAWLRVSRVTISHAWQPAA
jgi:hypothetical protein